MDPTLAALPAEAGLALGALGWAASGGGQAVLRLGDSTRKGLCCEAFHASPFFFSSGLDLTFSSSLYVFRFVHLFLRSLPHHEFVIFLPLVGFALVVLVQPTSNLTKTLRRNANPPKNYRPSGPHPPTCPDCTVLRAGQRKRDRIYLA